MSSIAQLLVELKSNLVKISDCVSIDLRSGFSCLLRQLPFLPLLCSANSYFRNKVPG